MSVECETSSQTPDGVGGVSTSDFPKIYDQHARPLLAWLSARVSRSDLEDVHQEIWMKVLGKMGSSFKGGNFRAWLFTVARNHIYDRQRKKLATPLKHECDEPKIDPKQETPCAVLLSRERRDQLKHCLRKLPEIRRRVVESRLLGNDYSSIAASLEISTSQAHSHFFAAKRQLREWLDSD